MREPISRELHIALPDWIPDWLSARSTTLEPAEARMRFAIDLAAMNVARDTGGPFGAAVFERTSGRLLSVGVNVVIAEHCSSAHAEMLALGLAQSRLGTHSLAAPRLIADVSPAEAGWLDSASAPAAGYQLVSSAEPCAMCLGAIAWSGVSEVLIGARDADIREIGFDEGQKPRAWRRGLEERGIRVIRDVLRREAREPLARYAREGAPVYNARPGGTRPRSGG